MKKTEIEKIIGRQIRDFSLFAESFTHKSFANENPDSPPNERLEFLGDAVLELATTKFLFQKFPDAPEGEMTKLRSALVKTDSLAEIAKKLGVGKFLKMSRGEIANGGAEKTPILADLFEAIVGAIFLDGGFAAAETFIAKNLFPRLDEIVKKNLHRDPKSAFQEFSQEKWGATPTFQIVSESGPDHDKTFVAAVFVDDEKKGEGVGSSKQKAEIAAAKNALENLKR